MNEYINDCAVVELTAEIGHGDDIYCVAHATNDFSTSSIVDWISSDDFVNYKLYWSAYDADDYSEYYHNIKSLQNIVKSMVMERDAYLPGSLNDEVQSHLFGLSELCTKHQIDENKRLAALIARARQDLVGLDSTFNKLCDALLGADAVFSNGGKIGDVESSTINNIRLHLKEMENVFERNGTIRSMQFGGRLFASNSVVSEARDVAKEMFDYAISDEHRLAIDLIAKRDHFDLINELVNGLKNMNLKSTARTSRARC